MYMLISAMMSPASPPIYRGFGCGVSHSTGVVVDHYAGVGRVFVQVQLSRGRDAGTINHRSRKGRITCGGISARADHDVMMGVGEGELKDRVGSRTAPVEGEAGRGAACWKECKR
jgi:hypothetical protein